MTDGLLNMESNVLFNTLSLVIAGVSFLALVLSIITFIHSSKVTKQVHSKEYEMFENLKYEVLKIIADLKAIDAKIAAPAYNGDDKFDYTQKIEKQHVDYSQEIESLIKMQSTPGYLLLLHSIKDDNKRKDLEETFRFFTTSKLKDVWVREWVHMIIESLKENASFERALNMNFGDLVKELCEMKSFYTEYYVSDAKKENDKTKIDLSNFLIIHRPELNSVGNFKLRKFVGYSDISISGEDDSLEAFQNDADNKCGIKPNTFYEGLGEIKHEKTKHKNKKKNRKMNKKK